MGVCRRQKARTCWNEAGASFGQQGIGTHGAKALPVVSQEFTENRFRRKVKQNYFHPTCPFFIPLYFSYSPPSFPSPPALSRWAGLPPRTQLHRRKRAHSDQSIYLKHICHICQFIWNIFVKCIRLEMYSIKPNIKSHCSRGGKTGPSLYAAMFGKSNKDPMEHKIENSNRRVSSNSLILISFGRWQACSTPLNATPFAEAQGDLDVSLFDTYLASWGENNFDIFHCLIPICQGGLMDKSSNEGALVCPINLIIDLI